MPELEEIDSTQHGNWFHSHDGIQWRRLSDGAVEVVDEGEKSMIFTASGWASIVAHVSFTGETTEAYYAALKAHMGVIP